MKGKHSTKPDPKPDPKPRQPVCACGAAAGEPHRLDCPGQD